MDMLQNMIVDHRVFEDESPLEFLYTHNVCSQNSLGPRLTKDYYQEHFRDRKDTWPWQDEVYSNLPKLATVVQTIKDNVGKYGRLVINSGVRSPYYNDVRLRQLYPSLTPSMTSLHKVGLAVDLSLRDDKNGIIPGSVAKLKALITSLNEALVIPNYEMGVYNTFVHYGIQNKKQNFIGSY